MYQGTLHVPGYFTWENNIITGRKGVYNLVGEFSTLVTLYSPSPSPPVCNQGCKMSGQRKCSHISKGSWVLSGSGQEKEKVKLNTVVEDRGEGRAVSTGD